MTRPSLTNRRPRPLWPVHALSFAALLTLLAGGLALSGCSGCRQRPPATQEEAEADKKKQKPEIPPFEIARLEVVPSDDAEVRNFVKPGHMVTTSLSAIANIADLRGELQSDVTLHDRRPVPVGDTKFHLVMTRPAVLPKGQRKDFESTYFIPHDAGMELSTFFLHHTLRAARGGNTVYEDFEGTHQMPPHQYLFVVLAANPNAYGYVKRLDSICPPYDELLDDSGEVRYYRVMLPTIQERAPVPSHAFSWTMIAYVLWDGLPVDRLSPDQQQALLDWLYWGGQLIISGPGSLDSLAGTFLAPYLPASSGGAVELTADALQPLNDSWSLLRTKTNVRQTVHAPATSPLIGVQLRGDPRGAFVEGTGQLVAERRVGRGRIVVTSFSLHGPEIVNWGSFDSFFNGVLLRRPAREFSVSSQGAPRTRWAGLPEHERNPLMVTTTRYFARDVGSAAKGASREVAADWHLDGCRANPVGGIAGWNDQSGVAKRAHRALQDAAGISIPKAPFVLSVLIAYLLVLVPLNWCVFRWCGRVEWAWAAAPIIAIVGAVAVIRVAQLDIGFVRSRTEIALLEMHAGHARAHLTRYTALYSSLSSAYQLRFEDPSALARPFLPTPSPDRLRPMTFVRDEGVHVSGFQVDSNSTGFVHSEQMYDPGGTLRLAGETVDSWQVENGTKLNLHQVQVLYRAPDGVVLLGQLQELPAGVAKRVVLELAPDGPEALSKSPVGGKVDVREILDLALWGLVLRPGDARLVAWTDDTLPGLVIEPSASQSRICTVVAVNLQYGPLPPSLPDVNLMVDVQVVAENSQGENDDPDVLPETKDNPPRDD
ncbi:MAG: hypothetical protein ACYC4U_14435 [Pirellulaceae bacterium]